LNRGWEKVGAGVTQGPQVSEGEASTEHKGVKYGKVPIEGKTKRLRRMIVVSKLGEKKEENLKTGGLRQPWA